MLYNDNTVCNKEFPRNYTVQDIKSDMGIKGRHRLVTYCGNTKTYKVDHTGFMFSITKA